MNEGRRGRTGRRHELASHWGPVGAWKRCGRHPPHDTTEQSGGPARPGGTHASPFSSRPSLVSQLASQAKPAAGTRDSATTRCHALSTISTPAPYLRFARRAPGDGPPDPRAPRTAQDSQAPSQIASSGHAAHDSGLYISLVNQASVLLILLSSLLTHTHSLSNKP